MSDLRPTLFLAQLSNLLAGNISIVHGVTGSSRTFMGEEAAGVDAVRIAWRASRPVKATSRWSAAPTMASARICCCSMMPAATLMQGPVQAGLGAQRSPGMVARLDSAHSWFWKLRAHAGRAAQNRWRG